MILRRRRSDLVKVGLGAVAVGVTGAAAASGEVGRTEARVFHHVNGLPDVHPGVLWPQQQFGNLAVGPAIVVVAALRRQWHLAASAAMATALKLGLERGVKAVVVRERPGTTVPGARKRGDVPHSGQSFVSGHATLVTALATVVTPHLPRRWRPVPAVAAALVCFARVYSGAHNPLDIVGGVGLGFVAGGTTNLVLGVPVVPGSPRAPAGR
jgi:undecaprenyl-diphosphatase